MKIKFMRAYLHKIFNACYTNAFLKNILTYFTFIVIALIGIIYGNTIRQNHTFLRIWGYDTLLLILVGIPFLYFQNKVQIPSFFETTISNSKRFLYPILFGALFGILDVFVIKIILHPEPYKDLPPSLQPFPYSLFLFFSGAFEIEVFYRLIPITILLLIEKWIFKGKYFNVFLWIAIFITSLREPLEQFPTGELWFVYYAFLSGFLMNFIQGVFFKKAGFLATLSLRLGHYLFWHILLGIYVQYLELQ